MTRASLAGTSLGGWLALDYAARRPERVEALALVCPAGIGRQTNFLRKAWPLLLLGPWGRRKMREMILGRTSDNPSPAAKIMGDYISLINANFRARIVKIPQFGDAALQRLTMPITVYAGAKDVLLDSAETKRRLEKNVPQVEMHCLPDAGHFIPGPTAAILDFLRRAKQA